MNNTNQLDVNKSHLISPANAHNLITEIIYLRKRLKRIGYTGDCAYEKKLSDYYVTMIKLYEEELLKLNKSKHL